MVEIVVVLGVVVVSLGVDSTEDAGGGDKLIVVEGNAETDLEGVTVDEVVVDDSEESVVVEESVLCRDKVEVVDPKVVVDNVDAMDTELMLAGDGEEVSLEMPLVVLFELLFEFEV